VTEIADLLVLAGRGAFLARIEISDFINEDRGRPILGMDSESAANSDLVSRLKLRKLPSEPPEAEDFH